MKRLISVLLAVWLPMSANALNVFSCEPEWAAMVEELEGDLLVDGFIQDLVDASHPAQTQLFDDLVAAGKSGADGKVF